MNLGKGQSESNPSLGSFVGIAGHKLQHALTTFGVSVVGRVCADFGCHVGGFTDCLLQGGAARVYAVDTGYGILDYRLRTDPRVQVMERTNVLHAEPPEVDRVTLITIDVGWTPQARVIPVVRRWLTPDDEDARIITLIKPHYELSAMGDEERADMLGEREDEPGSSRTKRTGRRRCEVVLSNEVADRVLAQVLKVVCPSVGVEVLGCTESPIRGGTSRRNRPGNLEYLALLKPVKV